ncbi:MAG: dicarboxylate/amino acid:cation symporter [Treponema sp.]|nr:dicarboxylate/amino acid:cation symporter [Treponema sp.]
MGKKKKLSLASWIFIGLLAGIIVGFAFIGHVEAAEKYIKPFGTLFLNLIKFIVVPIVLFSIISGVISLGDIKKVGSIGVRTILYYICTTAVAVIVGLALANLFKGFFIQISTTNLKYTAKTAPSFIETIINIFPKNIIEPMSGAIMLQIIVIALSFGFGIILAGEKGKVAADVIHSFNEVSMQIMGLIIKLSPLGVFCLIVPVIAKNGPSVLGSMAMVLLVAYIGYILHTLIIYSASVKVFAQLSPFAFFKNMMPAIVMAFSSASSVGTLPLNMECTEKMGAKKEIASFVLPLGATINMDGTAIYQGVCTIFIASCYGISLSLSQQLVVILTATLASIGTAGVPGAGMIMLAMVLQSVGLPTEGIALVAGIDRIFDMGRTVVNITGDAACTMVVSHMENK